MDRLRIKIVGESGAGLLSTGKIFIDALHHYGYHIVADREYPSVIKGGASCFTINISHSPIYALSYTADIMLAIDKVSLKAYFHELKDGGVLVHGYDRIEGISDILEEARRRKIKVISLKSRELAERQGGNVLVVNMVLLGMLWRALGFEYRVLAQEVRSEYGDKPQLLDIDLRVLKASFEAVSRAISIPAPRKKNGSSILLNGNKALSLGAVHCGVRAYFGYPMSPSSTILTYMSEMADGTGMVVRQIEDEISVVQMCIGAMFMGTRALTATSGGGYDLMTETVSLAGMIENPLVIIVAQRPGPATGLPTMTAQGDLNLAVYGAHGEFPRAVVSVSDPTDCFYLIQQAFNLAEQYQLPVLVLTDKDVAETSISTARFRQKNIPIVRGLPAPALLKKLKNSDRYALTASGVSKRWLPGSSEAFYYANSDEHLPDGTLTEKADIAALMQEKRMRKMKTLGKNLPEPMHYGVSSDADISFVGWGSSKKVMFDIIAFCGKEGIKVNFLHYNYVYPLKLKRLATFFKKNLNIHLIEGNYLGQFGELLAAKGFKFKGRLLKYDGRQFFVEEVREYVKKNVAQVRALKSRSRSQKFSAGVF